MNITSILIQAIQKNNLLGNDTFSSSLEDEVLSGRDDPGFERKWLRLFDQLENVEFNDNETYKIQELRELAFKAAFMHCSNSDLSSYISDDFELIAKAVMCDLEDGFSTTLLAAYIEGKIPNANVAAPEVPMQLLINHLQQFE